MQICFLKKKNQNLVSTEETEDIGFLLLSPAFRLKIKQDLMFGQGHNQTGDTSMRASLSIGCRVGELKGEKCSRLSQVAQHSRSSCCNPSVLCRRSGPHQGLKGSVSSGSPGEAHPGCPATLDSSSFCLPKSWRENLCRPGGRHSSAERTLEWPKQQQQQVGLQCMVTSSLCRGGS